MTEAVTECKDCDVCGARLPRSFYDDTDWAPPPLRNGSPSTRDRWCRICRAIAKCREKDNGRYAKSTTYVKKTYGLLKVREMLHHPHNTELRLHLNNSSCKVCQRSLEFGAVLAADRPNLDHMHSEEDLTLLRSYLCQNCNTGIGLFSDKAHVLTTAAQYVLLAGLDQPRRVTRENLPSKHDIATMKVMLTEQHELLNRLQLQYEDEESLAWLATVEAVYDGASDAATRIQLAWPVVEAGDEGQTLPAPTLTPTINIEDRLAALTMEDSM